MNKFGYIPSDEERRLVNRVLTELYSLLKEIYDGYDLQIIVAGSIAKDTYLAGESDIDIYIVSDKYRELFEIAKLKFPDGRAKKGELLIWNLQFKGFDVDLVFIPPDYEKKDTLYHTEFMIKNLSPEMRNEVRKAKAFFKSRGLYGAEIGGITGIALEELVRNYGSLKEICRLFTKYEQGDLWIQDPVLDKPRNLLASINKVKYERIRKACAEYLEKKDFQYKRYGEEDFLSEYSGYKLVECNRKSDVSIDYQSTLSVCIKTGNQIKNMEREVDFDCEVYVDDKILIAFKIRPEKLSDKREICIPKKLGDAIERFKRKHGDVDMYEKDGFLCALVDRKVTNPPHTFTNDLLDKLSSHDYSCRLIT